MDLILIGIGIAVLLINMRNLYEDHWNKRLSVEMKLSNTAVYPGDKITLTEIITNGKWLPLPMIKVKFAIDRSLEFSNIDKDVNISDKCYKSECFSILFYQKT